MGTVRLTAPTIKARRGLAPPSHKSAIIADSMALAHHAPCRAQDKKGDASQHRLSYNNHNIYLCNSKLDSFAVYRR